MILTEQQRRAARSNLERLTGELARLYQKREQLKDTLGEPEGDVDTTAAAEAADEKTLAEVEAQLAADAAGPVVRVLQGQREGGIPRDDPQRRALRAQLRLIRGGLA